MIVRIASVLVLATATLLAGCGERTLKDAGANVAVQQVLAVPPAWAHGDRELWNAVRVAYRYNGGALLWLDDAKPKPQARRLERAIADAAKDGLDPADYDVRALRTLARVDGGLFSADRYLPTAAAEVDARLAYAAAKLARDLGGRVPPDALGGEWIAPQRKVSLGKLVYQAATSDDVEASLRALAPKHPQYAKLRDALGAMRARAARGGWPEVDPALAVKGTKQPPDLAPFRVRLAAGGYYAVPGNAPAPDDDGALREALRRFQREHGLVDDGIPGKATVAAMNVPAEARIRQLEINLERLRWLPESLGETHILVNVPTFHLEAVEDGRTALEMRIVAGKRGSPTPIFSDAMETLVFSPYWNVPASILRNEIVPALMDDPAHLSRQNMEVVKNGAPVDPYYLLSGDPSVRVRQRPGAGNALGHVKFLFPNRYDVYLHDTPADSLFERAARNFSHGCVRVERPTELARWVLRGRPEWPPEAIEAAMHSGREKHVRLEKPIPVHIVYFTAWADASGTVQYVDDVYGHDERHAQLIPAAWPPMPQPVEPVAANEAAAAH